MKGSLVACWETLAIEKLLLYIFVLLLKNGQNFSQLLYIIQC